jgi:hypothetical protein
LGFVGVPAFFLHLFEIWAPVFVARLANSRSLRFGRDVLGTGVSGIPPFPFALLRLRMGHPIWWWIEAPPAFVRVGHPICGAANCRSLRQAQGRLFAALRAGSSLCSG